jgi:hypothetical protein
MDRRVMIAAKDEGAILANTIAQFQVLKMPAVGAFARGAFPALNFADGLAALECDPFQYIHEAGKAKIGNFAAPQSLHAIQVQILEAHDIVLAAQFMSQLKMMLLVPVGNLRAMLRQGSAGAFVALRPFHFARKFAVQLAGLADRTSRFYPCWNCLWIGSFKC